MNEQPEVYVIPANITDNGNVIRGQFKKKNAYEAAAFIAVGLILSVLILGFIPLIARGIIFFIFLMLAMIALAGIKGESLIEFILEKIFFGRKKRVMKYRLPRREAQKESKWDKKKKQNEDLE